MRAAAPASWILEASEPSSSTTAGGTRSVPWEFPQRSSSFRCLETRLVLYASSHPHGCCPEEVRSVWGFAPEGWVPSSSCIYTASLWDGGGLGDVECTWGNDFPTPHSGSPRSSRRLPTPHCERWLKASVSGLSSSHRISSSGVNLHSSHCCPALQGTYDPSATLYPCVHEGEDWDCKYFYKVLFPRDGGRIAAGS